MPVVQPTEVFGHHPFTRTGALDAGLTENQLEGPRVRRLFRGAYVAVGVDVTLEVRAEAAMLVLPDGAALSHHTAAALRRLPVEIVPDIHATVPVGAWRPRIRGICVHQAVAQPIEHGGWLLTPPAANWRELAAYLTRTELVVVGDAMVQRGLVTCPQLAAVASAKRFAGCRVARVAAALVRPNVDSPPETRVRLFVVDRGLPEPVTGFRITDAAGGWLALVDLAWPAYRVIIEYDGDLHRTSRRKWRYDSRKRDQLRELGWTVLVLTADDLDQHAGTTIQRIAAALRRGGWAGRAGRT